MLWGGEERSASFVSREELSEHLKTFVDWRVDEHGVPWRRGTPCTLWTPQVVIIAFSPKFLENLEPESSLSALWLESSSLRIKLPQSSPLDQGRLEENRPEGML